MKRNLHQLLPALALLSFHLGSWGAVPQHIVLVMADDMGWGQTGYRGHPLLETPNLDAMAANGLRLDRFYAGAPVCSPTRASVLTGRTNDRTGVWEHGYGMRLQERTLAEVLGEAGYATGHFGKWHLNGLRGPGVPVLGDDPYGPGGMGFGEWITVTNFFDLNPVMSRGGEFIECAGDSSEVVVGQALEFIGRQVEGGRPSLSVVWYGSPHSPFRGLESDRALFPDDGSVSVDHHAELVAMDRSIGTLRAGLRELGIAEDSLVWFCSDNGGLGKISPPTVGGLRGVKGSFYEGGLRVPCVIEWPGGPGARGVVSGFPASTMDIFPTLVELLGLPESVLLQPQDGMSLLGVIAGEVAAGERRDRPIPFRQMTKGALLDNEFKLVALKGSGGEWKTEVYDLSVDPFEENDIGGSRPRDAGRMRAAFLELSASIDRSVEGQDYPEGRVDPVPPGDTFWQGDPRYAPYLEEWTKREDGLGDWLRGRRKAEGKKTETKEKRKAKVGKVR